MEWEYNANGLVAVAQEVSQMNLSGMHDRRVYLGEWGEVRLEQGCTSLTPNESAARSLGAEPLSLENLARQVFGEERVAHPLAVQRFLREAVEEALGSTDPEGVARWRRCER